jgi:hypothetical protein
MSQPHAPTDDRHGPHYEIRLQGHLDPRWAAWFDGLSLTRESDGTTGIHGSVVDQAALHGSSKLIRWAGLSAVVGGSLLVAIQRGHEVVSLTSTPETGPAPQPKGDR